MRCGSLRAFQEYIVVRVEAGAHPLDGLYPNALIADCAQYGCNFAITAMEPSRLRKNSCFVSGYDFIGCGKTPSWVGPGFSPDNHRQNQSAFRP
jgi:hypothetical protein